MNRLDYKLKTFLTSFSVAFLMVILPKHDFSLPQLISPVAKPTMSDTVKPKLEQNNNDFALKKDNSLIATAKASQDYDDAKAYMVVDFDNGNILAEKNSNQSLPIASLTKLMTAVVALDLADKDNQFVISKKSSEVEPTKMGLIPGQNWSLEELLNGMLLTSANDAAYAIMEGVNQKYNSQVFIEAMNQKAKFLKLNQTNFNNPAGLDSPDNFSSTKDLVSLTHYALINYPLISEIVQKDYQFYPQTNTHKQADLYNWNGLLSVYPGIEGVKIGNTEQADYTTIVLSKRDNQQVLVVLLGAPGVLERDLWASELLDLGFKNKPAVEVTAAQLKAKYQTWHYWN
jgi:serine-type D-Ala-D-Ala carboxypeptidase (penicillin-binding protein 5/6)